jgi:protein-disulfide isomerase
MPLVLNDLLRNNPEKVRLVFKHSPLPMHPKAPLAHEAALAAGAQGKFWEMHDLLFASQAQLEPADLERYAGQLHLDVSAFKTALASHQYRVVVSRDLAEAMAFGLDGTPAFLINGRRLVGAQSLAALQAEVDAALSGKPLTPESVDVSPDRLNVTGAPARGAASALVTIVAFSDLQCPFCAAANPTLSDVMNRYAGRVKLVFKHFPLDMHVNAPLAHRAALAAGEQGKFWEMHDALFANQRMATRQGVVELAGRLKLDLPRFEGDLVSERFTAIIERDKAEGSLLGVDGTPTFFIEGARLVGARSAAEFAAAIDRQLQKRGALDPAVLRTLGAFDAPLTITWFDDLRSPLNAQSTRLVKQLVTAYPTKVRVTFKHAPLASRPESVTAYDSALAAGAQGRFWEMVDLLSANPTVSEPRELALLVARLGLDADRFAKDVRDRTFREVADADLADAHRLGVNGTPTFVIDGERIDGVVTFSEIKDIVDRYLERPALAARP